jgi:hypothetical protein
MTYKKTSTTLAIVMIAALMVSASVVIALTITTGGVGISAANAQVKLKHVPQCPNYNTVLQKCEPPIKVRPA